jgi:hypothetical protein
MFGHRPTARPDEHGRRRLHRWGLLTLAVVSGAMAGSIVSQCGFLLQRSHLIVTGGIATTS